ncbi:MAG: hypothetical protein ABIQ89_03525 [Candidatus Saccharimonadales bacterium]
MESQQKIWRSIVKLYNTAVTAAKVQEKKRFIFLKIREYDTYLSSYSGIESAHLQANANLSDQLQIYYLYFLRKAEQHGPDIYEYIGFSQHSEDVFPEGINIAYFYINAAAGQCELRNDLEPPTPEESGRIIQDEIVPYLEHCVVQDVPSGNLKLVDDFLAKLEK